MLAHPRLTLVPLWNLAPFRDWATRGWDWIRLACCPCCLEVRERVWYTCEPVTLGLALETAWGLVAKPGSDVRGVVTVLEGRSGRLSATGTPDSVASGTGTAGGAAAGTDAPAEMGGLVSGNSATLLPLAQAGGEQRLVLRDPFGRPEPDNGCRYDGPQRQAIDPDSRRPAAAGNLVKKPGRIYWVGGLAVNTATIQRFRVALFHPFNSE